MTSVSSAAPAYWPEGLTKYRPIEVLGRGRAGVVWRAEQASTGNQLALKVLEADSLHDRDAFRREVYALAQLKHPGVVSVLDHGVSAGSPWYAMALVEGIPLSRWMREGTGRDTVLRCLRNLCVTLSYVHGEGVVHRDLKPSNVVVRPDGTPTLIDFGLATRFAPRGDREVLEIGGDFSGSFDYAAPEQLGGQFVDARADLYAVGCTLYEILTGSPPFRGDLNTVITGHLSRMPISPSAIVADVPASLETVVLSLLAKDPRDRLGYAADVVRALDAVLGPGGSSDGLTSSRPYFYRPGFTGRADALTTLRAGLTHVQAGHGDCILIGGVSGIGKTRLMMELTRYVQSGTLLVTGECVAAEGRDALRGKTPLMDAWRPLLRTMAMVCQTEGEDTVRRVLAERASVLVDVEPSYQSFVTKEAAPVSGTAARERLVESFAATVEAFVDGRTVVVILDDLQWADELTLACLDRLRRNDVRARPLLIVGAYRLEEASVELQTLVDDLGPRAFELGPLDEPGVAAILSDMLALRQAPEALLSFVSGQSEGNPFFVREYVYEAADEGLLSRSSEGRWVLEAKALTDTAAYEGVATPVTIRDLAWRRLARLPLQAQNLARAGSVLGRTFDPHLATIVAQLSGDESQAATLELMRRKIVEEDEAGGLRFAHDKLREIAYESIDRASAPRLHLRAAESLFARHREASNFAEHYAELAHHFAAGEDVPAACRYQGLAGEHAFRRGAFVETRRFLAAAIENDEKLGHITDPTVRGRWLRTLGNAYFALGDLATCIERTEMAIRSFGRKVPDTSWGWRGLALAEGARLLGSRAHNAATNAQTSERLREESIAATQLAASFYYDARLIPSAAAILLGVNAAERCADAGRLADSYSRLGYVLGAAGLHGQANRYFTRAHASGELDPDPTSLALSLYMDGMYRLGVAEWDTAVALGRRSFVLGQQSGNVQEAEVAQTIAAHALYYSGRIATAWREYQSILESSRRRANRQHIGWGLFLSGRSCLALGRIDEANELLEEGYEHLRELPDIVSQTMCEGSLAWAALRQNRIDRAAEVAGSLLSRLRAAKRPAVGQCVDAYGSLATVALELSALRPATASRQNASRAVNELRLLSWLFPVGRPAAHRCRAMQARMAGRATSARRLAVRAVEQATRLGMPYEELLAREEVWRNSPPEEADMVNAAMEASRERLNRRLDAA